MVIDTLVLKHWAISSHSADEITIVRVNIKKQNHNLSINTRLFKDWSNFVRASMTGVFCLVRPRQLGSPAEKFFPEIYRAGKWYITPQLSLVGGQLTNPVSLKYSSGQLVPVNSVKFLGSLRHWNLCKLCHGPQTIPMLLLELYEHRQGIINNMLHFLVIMLYAMLCFTVLYHIETTMGWYRVRGTQLKSHYGPWNKMV